MYVGHAAVALALKSRDPRVAIVPLTLACFGPDWLELVLMLPAKREGMAVYTHSIPAVLIGGAIAAALYAAFRRPGWPMILVGWLLHWPADLITGHKPLLFGTPLVGLDLYNVPLADFVLESVAIVIGCAYYARRFAPRGELRRIVYLLGATLILLQGAVDVALWVLRPRQNPFASAGTVAASCCMASSDAVRQPIRMQLAFLVGPNTARERWRRTAPEVS